MKQAFTLVELLVVVLIIGVLTSIAIPMYQGAVDKSHWSTMLPAAKAIKDAEEAIKMTNGEYTSQMDDLDVTMNNENLNFTLTTPNNMSDPNVIRVTNPKLANVRLASYLDDSPKFAGQLHCEALKTDDRANRLCGKLLGGDELTSQDNYIAYLLDQSVTKEICGNAGGSWSTSKTKCYSDTAARCSDLGMAVVSTMDDQCGYVGVAGKDQSIFAEGICYANGGGGSACQDTKVYEGGKCIGIGNNVECGGSTIYAGGICDSKGGNACSHSKVYSGGICQGTGCVYATIYDGGKCIATASTACVGAIYYGTGCCEDYGKGYCPSDHKCPQN